MKKWSAGVFSRKPHYPICSKGERTPVFALSTHLINQTILQYSQPKQQLSFFRNLLPSFTVRLSGMYQSCMFVCNHFHCIPDYICSNHSYKSTFTALRYYMCKLPHTIFKVFKAKCSLSSLPDRCNRFARKLSRANIFMPWLIQATLYIFG